MSIENAEKLIQDIDQAINNWNERSAFKLGGVGNLSMSDLDSLRIYAETYISNDWQWSPGLTKPMGNIKNVFDEYGLNY